MHIGRETTHREEEIRCGICDGSRDGSAVVLKRLGIQCPHN